MAVFVRQNLAIVTATFTAADGTATQPTTVNAYMAYHDTSGVSRRDTVAMTYNSTTNEWSGEWDTSNSGQGSVDWMVLGTGTLQAATQGCFQIEANSANLV